MTLQNIPYYTTEFVSRSKEIREIIDHLNEPDCRVLTIIGLGGSGKTRLAIQVGVDQHHQFRDGVYFVNLQPISHAENIVLSLADALQFQFYEEVEPEQQMLDYLQEKQMLLILDNFEHLVSNFQLIINLIQNAPFVKLLITSRHALGIQEEWLFPIQGLNFPDKYTDLEEDYSSVELFTRRARQVRKDFSLKQDWVHVCRICQLVEGMPLAIELAATWLKSLTCEAIANQIKKNIDFLVTSLHNLPDRHQSVRAVFDYSWLMLSLQEQETFMKLSIFRGGFTYEAAEKIASANPFILLSLVEKSFLRRTDSGRYQIHELMRQYGLEKLKYSSEHDGTWVAYSKYFLSLLQQNTDNLMGEQQRLGLDEIELDYANIRAAWELAVDQSDETGISSAVESFYWFCVFRGYFQDAINLFDYTLAHSASPLIWSKVRSRQISLIAHAVVNYSTEWHGDLQRCLKIAHDQQDIANIGFSLATLGFTELIRDNYIESIKYYRQCLEVFEQVGDLFYNGRILRQIGYAYLSQWRFDDAEPWLQQSLEFVRQTGDKVTEANCLYNLGSIAGFRNDFDGWFSGYEAALRIRRELDDRASTALNLGGLALGFFFRGDLDSATAYAHEALEIATDINHRESKGQALIWLGYLACVQEKYDESHLLFDRCIHLVPDMTKAGWVQLGLAMIACGEEDYEIARKHLELTLSIVRWLSWHRSVMVITMALILIYEGEEKLGLGAISLALNHSTKGANFLERWPFFIRLREQLRNDLGQHTFTLVWEHGKTLNLDETIREMTEKFTKSEQERHNSIISDEMHDANSTLDEPLTLREHEILILISNGLSNQEIADQLYIAKSTVKRHINNCYGKLAVNSRTKAILKAQMLHLVETTPPSN